MNENNFKIKKYKKINVKNLILLIFFLVFLVMFGYSLTKICLWYIDSLKIKNNIELINETITPTEIPDNNETEIIDSPLDSQYTAFTKVNMIDVNLDELLAINKDTKGWIQVSGTNINYPFVQTTNNDYYLTHSFDNKYNRGGWVFLDFRNNVNDFDKNTILYAHGRSDKTMFGSLKNILTNSWLENKNNYIIKISTTKSNSVWQIFSYYRIEETSDYLSTTFINDTEYEGFLNKITTRSEHDFNFVPDVDSKIITLSTCYKDNFRVVLHAKLIKISNKS